MILSIDPGTTSGWALFGDSSELLCFGQFSTGGIGDVARFMERGPAVSLPSVAAVIGGAVVKLTRRTMPDDLWERDEILEVVCEGQFVGKYKSNALIKLIRIAEMWRTTAYYREGRIYPTMYQPSQWQGPTFQALGRVSGSPKRKAVEAFREIYNWKMPLSWEHAADAVLMGRHHINQTKETT